MFKKISVGIVFILFGIIVNPMCGLIYLINPGFFKKSFITLFNLNDLSKIINNERQKQKSKDKILFEKFLVQEKNKLINAHNVKLTSMKYDMNDLQDQINKYEADEKNANRLKTSLTLQQNELNYMTNALVTDIYQYIDYASKLGVRLQNKTNRITENAKKVEDGKMLTYVDDIYVKPEYD